LETKGDIRCRGVLSVVFKTSKCTSHLGIGLVRIGVDDKGILLNCRITGDSLRCRHRRRPPHRAKELWEIDILSENGMPRIERAVIHGSYPESVGIQDLVTKMPPLDEAVPPTRGIHPARTVQGTAVPANMKLIRRPPP
jgi:hypothetical protein